MENKPETHNMNGILNGGAPGHLKPIMTKQIHDDSYGKQHDWIKLCLVLATIIIFILTLGFNTLASLAWTSNSTLFPATTTVISDKYYTDITPAGSTFIIWSFIYTWQGIWLLYSFICLFRRTSNGHYLYLKPDFLNFGLFIAYIVNLCSNIIWIFLWGYSHIGWALLFLVIMTFSLYVALFISHRKLNTNEDELRSLKLAKDVWMTRFFVQNGIAFYATWISIASNLNFAIFIAWQLGADNTNAGTAALFLVLAAIIVYFILENFIWRNYLLYTFSPWIVIVVALIGSISKNWQASSPTRNNIITLIMIIIVALLIVARLIMFILYKTKLKHRINTAKVGDLSENINS